MDRDKLLDRIRRLLRLSESPNVHEAAAAAATAQELMARHRIEVAALEPPGERHGFVDLRDAPLESSKRLRDWKIELAAAIARANGCRIYLRTHGKLEDVVLVGRPEDAELVRILHEALTKQVESLTRKHGEGRDRAFCNAFRLGAVVTIAERLSLAAREARQKALSVGEPGADVRGLAGHEDGAPADHPTALAVRRLDERDEALDRYLDETLGLRPGRSKPLRADAEGFARGRIAGHSIALEKARGSRTDRDG